MKKTIIAALVLALVLPGCGAKTAETAPADSETDYDGTLENNRHSIYTGTMGDEEVRMIFTRRDNELSAAYITRADEEKSFEGQLNENGFELKGENGDTLEGNAAEDELGCLALKGEGNISGKNVEFLLTPDTYFKIGENDYYSAAGRRNAEETEAFARQIKAAANDKDELLQLIEYPVNVNFGGELKSAENEEEMSELYDRLMETDGFREKIENMYTKYLFENYMGVCIENEAVWFEKNSDGEYRIIAFNA